MFTQFSKVLLAFSLASSSMAFANKEVESSKSSDSVHQRDTWYIEFAVSPVAGATVHSEDEATTIKDDFTKFGMQFGVGATINSKLLLGLDLNAFNATSNKRVGNVTRRSWTSSNTLAVATFFPKEEGLFFRGGLGLAQSSMEFEVDPIIGNTSTERDNVHGIGTLVGVGYAWWVGKQFNLSAKLDYSEQFYNNRKIHDAKLDRVSFWTLGMGFSWF